MPSVLDTISNNNLFSGLIGALVGGLVSYWAAIHVYRMERRNEHENRRADEVQKRQLSEKDKLADLMSRMAEHLGGMADAFDKPDIPHTDGRAFKGLYEELRELFEAHMSDTTKTELGQFQYLVDRAAEQDKSLYSVKSVEELEPETRAALRDWSRQARRLKGELLVVATKIRNSDTLSFPSFPDWRQSGVPGSFAGTR